MKKFYLLFLLMLLPLVASADVCALQNEEKEPYAVLSEDNTVLTFYYDDQKAAHNGMDVGPFTESYDKNRQRFIVNTGWYEQRESITSVVFDASFADCTTLTSTAYWFYNLENLSSITGISNLKTDNVTNMEGMFQLCSGLTSLDVTGFKTDNVTSMNGMFYNCFGLTSLDVTGFKTDNVTNMGSMFAGCSGLTSLDVTGFKTDNVTNMSAMFSGCSGLTSLDVTGFKTDNVVYMRFMFDGCSSLTSLDVTGFKTDNVTDMNGMFYNCSGLTSLDVTGFKTDNVTAMLCMFQDCSGLTSLDVTGFKTDNVTDMSWMFFGCSGLTSLDVTGFKTDNVTGMVGMFSGCSSLKTIYAGNGWSTANVQYGGDTFIGCTSLVGGAGTHYDESHTDHTYAHIDGGTDNPGYFTDKNATPSTGGDPEPEPEPYAVLSEDNTVLTFYYDDQKAARNGMGVGPFTSSYDKDRQRSNINSGWDEQRESITSVVFDESFANCTTLTSTACWFYGLQNLSSITGISNLKTDKVTDMCFMFRDCSGLTSLDVTGFKTDNVTNMRGLFEGCSSLTSLDVTGFKTDNVTAMYCMFQDCSGLKTIYAGEGWSTAEVTAGKDMFKGCTSLVGGTGTRYDESHTGYNYARIDGGASNPGYFTSKGGESPAEETEETITISSAGQTTWCSAYDLDFTGVEGLKAYTAGGYHRTKGTIWLMRVYEVPAGEGILLMGDEGEYKIPRKSTTAYYMNMFRGTLKPITINETEGEYTNYYLSNGDSGVGFYKVNGSVDLKANRAYLPLLKGTASAGTRFIGIDFGDGTTSIREVKSGEVKGEEWYTLQGQRVAKPGKGLYIRNGHKVVIK